MVCHADDQLQLMCVQIGVNSPLIYLGESSLNNQFMPFTRKYASDDSCYNDHFVMQHDLLRELAIYQSKLERIKQRKRLIIDMSGNNFPEWWMDQKQHPLNASLLSISTGFFFLCFFCLEINLYRLLSLFFSRMDTATCRDFIFFFSFLANHYLSHAILP